VRLATGLCCRTMKVKGEERSLFRASTRKIILAGSGVRFKAPSLFGGVNREKRGQGW
jgi:hypothetical protein